MIYPLTSLFYYFTIMGLSTVIDYCVMPNFFYHLHSSVELDPVLSSLSLHKGEYAERLRWEELFGRVFNKLSPACRFVLPGQPPVIRKGKLEPISMKLATRAGNKKVRVKSNRLHCHKCAYRQPGVIGIRIVLVE